MTRGFVTLATGNETYYQMAVNMLRSFRVHNKDGKMAILCDRENEYTAEFDDVVILDSVQGNYKDKFRLLVDSPYDESFFIEPDCLIYHNLDFFWDLLAKESDFSAFGWNNAPLSIWFKSEESQKEIKKLLPDISVNPIFNPGYFFIRNGETCQKMYQDCLRIANYIVENPVLKAEQSLWCKGNLRDDPILFLAMQNNSMLCNAMPEIGKCISLPSGYKFDCIDMKNGKLDVTDKKGNKFSNCSLLHFSTRRANEEGLYLWQKIVTDIIYNNRSDMLLKLVDNKIVWKIIEIYRYFKVRICRLLAFKK